jgi:hypothetical protein
MDPGNETIRKTGREREGEWGVEGGRAERERSKKYF